MAFRFHCEFLLQLCFDFYSNNIHWFGGDCIHLYIYRALCGPSQAHISKHHKCHFDSSLKCLFDHKNNNNHNKNNNNFFFFFHFDEPKQIIKIIFIDIFTLFTLMRLLFFLFLKLLYN
jgi:hypothetical protein